MGDKEFTRNIAVSVPEGLAELNISSMLLFVSDVDQVKYVDQVKDHDQVGIINVLDRVKIWTGGVDVVHINYKY